MPFLIHFPLLSFFFSCYADLHDLHSFPTRRSSDLSIGSVCVGRTSSWPRGRDCAVTGSCRTIAAAQSDRKSTRLNSSHSSISYAVFCLKKKKARKRLHTKRCKEKGL